MKYLSPLLILLSFCMANGQVIAAYSGTNTSSSAAIPDINATALSAGSGVDFQNSSIFEYRKWTNGSSLDPNDYFEWSIGANTDFTASITNINIAYDAGNKSPETLELRTSVDNYTTVFYTASISANTTGTLTIPIILTTSSGGSITFRLFGYNSANANSSRFGIDGGLNTQLGLANTGITIEGSLSYNGLYYDGTSWLPYAPNNTTGSVNAIVASGVYDVNPDFEINNLDVRATSTLNVEKGKSVIVNGDLTVSGAIILDSDSDEYSSLIVYGTVAGDIVYKRHVNNTANVGEDDSNDLIAPPVSGEAFDSFITNNSNILSNSSNTLYLFGPFDKTTGSYLTYSNIETSTLDAGNGYRAASTDAGTFTFSGVVNTGIITKTISHSGPAYEEWNLIGNPYPSYIKLSEFLNVNQSQLDPSSAAIYGYDGDASDGWTIWNKAYSDNNPNAIITPGQGFLLASKLGGGNITFNPNMRTTGNADDFILGRVSNPSTSSHISIKIFNQTKSYSTDIYFNSNASRGLDIGYDAAIFGNAPQPFSIYSQLVEDNLGRNMAIQSLGENDIANITIPLGVIAHQGEQLIFSTSESNLPSTTKIYLEDQVTNTSTLLNSGDYTLTPNMNINGTGRFYLKVTDSSLSTVENTSNNISIYNDQDDKKVIINGQLSENTTVTIIDLQGRIVKTLNLENRNTSQSIDVSSLNSGVYIIQIFNENQRKTQKMILR